MSFLRTTMNVREYEVIQFEKRATAVFVLTCLSVLIFLYLLFRNFGIYPSVFADEYTYSRFARLLPLSESSIPNYIFLYIYSFTSYCGDAFGGCVKVLNGMFFVCAIPFVYLVARMVTGRAASMAVALLAALSPVNSYTAYFMPESLYFFCFWVLAWSVLRTSPGAHGLGRWFLVGATLGVSSLVKPHALFFIPAIVVYISYVSFKERMLLTVRPLKVVIVTVGAAIGIKFLISYILAGYSGLTFFGSIYGAVIDSTSANDTDHMDLLSLAYVSLQGHMIVISLLYGLPLFLGFVVILRQFREVGSISGLEKLSVFLFLALFVLIVVASVFTASVADSGPYESAYRLHVRYYNFLLPGFFIIAAGSLGAVQGQGRNICLYVISIFIVMIALYAVYSNIVPYTPNHIDSPELRGIHTNSNIFCLFSGLSVLALCVGSVSCHIGARIYMFVALPVLVGTSAYFINQEQRNRMVTDVYDYAGIFMRNYVSKDDVSNVVVVGSEVAGLYRTLYYLDDAEATLRTIPGGAFFDISEIPSDKEWVVLIGDHSFSDDAFVQLHMNGFTLLHVTGANYIDFRKSSWPGIVSKIRGVSSVEPWGAWSLDDVVTIEFLREVPTDFRLSITAHAFGPNVGQEFVATIGDSAATFSLDASTDTKTLVFRNVERSRILFIKVPVATSPEALGVSGDQRRLGIGLVEITLHPL